MTDKTLLPCPFCGGDAKIYTPPITIGDDEADVDWMRAMCTRCGVSRGFTRFHNHDRQSADFKRACAEAITVWNERPVLNMSTGMTVEGYAAIFDRPDRGGDIIRKGAFGRIKKDVPLLYQHRPDNQIGTIVDLYEDDRGLRFRAEIASSISIKHGQGISFGYRVRHSEQRSTYRVLLDLELVEISIVDHPMQPDARVIGVEP